MECGVTFKNIVMRVGDDERIINYKWAKVKQSKIKKERDITFFVLEWFGDE